MRAASSLKDVRRVSRCDLRVGPSAWPFAAENASAIDAHWERRRRANPLFFNGAIHLLESYTIADEVFSGRLLRTDFKSQLYWRDTGFPEAGVFDAFGSALIRSCEGHVLLGRQREGHVNSGLVYLPGGFIDARDVRADGTIAIDESIAREVAEETGLRGEDIERLAGYTLTFAGPLISIAAEFRSALPADVLSRRVLDFIAQDAQSELVGVVIVRSVRDMEGLAMPEYARILLPRIMAG